MENKIKIFENKDFVSLRTLEENGKILFCGKDVAASLGYSNTKDAIKRHCRWGMKHDRVLMANNLPYQQFIDRGYFAVKESIFEVNGLKKTYQQTFVTGKGQRYVINLLKKYYGKEVLQ